MSEGGWVFHEPNRLPDKEQEVKRWPLKKRHCCGCKRTCWPSAVSRSSWVGCLLTARYPASSIVSVIKTHSLVIVHEGGQACRVGSRDRPLWTGRLHCLDAPIKRVAAPFTPVPFSPPLEGEFIPRPLSGGACRLGTFQFHLEAILDRSSHHRQSGFW